jgi:hypothetical protein
MSCELAQKVYEQAKDRLEEYVSHAPPSAGDRLGPGAGEREQEIERLKHAVDIAEQAYERAKLDHVDG